MKSSELCVSYNIHAISWIIISVITTTPACMRRTFITQGFVSQKNVCELTGLVEHELLIQNCFKNGKCWLGFPRWIKHVPWIKILTTLTIVKLRDICRLIVVMLLLIYLSKLKRQLILISLFSRWYTKKWKSFTSALQMIWISLIKAENNKWSRLKLMFIWLVLMVSWSHHDTWFIALHIIVCRLTSLHLNMSKRKGSRLLYVVTSIT